LSDEVGEVSVYLIEKARTDREIIGAEHISFLSFHCLNIAIYNPKPLGNKKDKW